MHCIRLIKDEFAGLVYDPSLPKELQNDADRRESRVDLALAWSLGKAKATATRITTQNGEVLDAIVFGHQSAIDKIGSTWEIETKHSHLNVRSEHVMGWMTVKGDDPYIFVRQTDIEKAPERLRKFFEPAIEHLKREIAA